MEWNELFNKGLELETIQEKERQELYMSELNRAREAAETIKRLRLLEGPEDKQVFTISRLVETAGAQRTREAKKPVLDPMKERIRVGMLEENRHTKETYEVEGGLMAVYKVPPAIIPLHGSEAVHVEKQAFAKSKKGAASL